jgi:hypothetical protein
VSNLSLFYHQTAGIYHRPSCRSLPRGLLIDNRPMVWMNRPIRVASGSTTVSALVPTGQPGNDLTTVPRRGACITAKMAGVAASHPTALRPAAAGATPHAAGAPRRGRPASARVGAADLRRQSTMNLPTIYRGSVGIYRSRRSALIKAGGRWPPVTSAGRHPAPLATSRWPLPAAAVPTTMPPTLLAVPRTDGSNTGSISTSITTTTSAT